jgi:hypothetical protein
VTASVEERDVDVDFRDFRGSDGLGIELFRLMIWRERLLILLPLGCDDVLDFRHMLDLLKHTSYLTLLRKCDFFFLGKGQS